jgi:hypothetical protein
VRPLGLIEEGLRPSRRFLVAGSVWGRVRQLECPPRAGRRLCTPARVHLILDVPTLQLLGELLSRGNVRRRSIIGTVRNQWAPISLQAFRYRGHHSLGSMPRPGVCWRSSSQKHQFNFEEVYKLTQDMASRGNGSVER